MSDILDVSASATLPFFRLPKEWRSLDGFAFGLRETPLVGIARVRLPEALDFAALDAGMAEVISEKLPEKEAAGRDALSLVRRAMFWTGALQRQAKIPVFGEAYIDGPRPGIEGEEFGLAVPSFVPAATTLALSWVGAAIDDFLLARYRQSFQEGQLSSAEIVEALEKHRPAGINSYRFLLAAHKLGIPARHFTQGVFALGTGARMRWLYSSYTDRTSFLGSRLAANKMFSAEVLRGAGLPAATHAEARSPQEAVTIARRLGYPVVVKPADRQQGRGVAANLDSDEAVADAYQAARRISDSILVEKHFEGDDFRLVVVDGRLLSVTARLPGCVFGDGEHTILELIDLENRDPVRVRRSRERRGMHLTLDEEARTLLAEAGKTPDTVPAKDEFVRLKRRANISAGGSGKPMKPDEIHPDNARLAERAAKALRLDIAGVDFLIPDIRKSWREVGGLICEVNTQPQIGFISAQPLIERLFSKGSKIPVVLLISPTAPIDWQRVQETLASTHVGYSSAAGLWLGPDQILPAQKNGLVAGKILLSEQDAEAALIQMAPAEVSRLGLPCDSCDALVIAAPDRWTEADRKRLPEILALAGPHAGQTVHTPSPSSGADEAVLEDVCARLLRTAIAAAQTPST